MSLQHMSSESSNVTTEIISTSDLGTVSAVETVETTTTTTTKTTTSVRITPSPDKEVVRTIEPGLVKSNEDRSDSTGPQVAKSSENKVIVIGSDGKQTPGIMNIQSVCPSNKSGTTFVLLNKEGSQMKISLTPKSMDDKNDESRNDGDNSLQSMYLL